MCMFLSIVAISTLNCLFLVRAEVYSSIYKIEKILEIEAVLLGYLRVLIETERSHGRNLPWDVIGFYEKCRSEHERRRFDPNFAGNPINDYHIVDRYINGWRKYVLGNLVCGHCPATKPILDFEVSYNYIIRNNDGPALDDLENIADAIARLTQMYNLELSDIFSGKIMGTQTDPLDIREIEHIIDVLHSRDLFEDEGYWLESLLAKINTDSDVLPLPEQRRFYKKLGRAYYMAGVPHEAIDWLAHYVEKVPDDKNMTAELDWYMSLDHNKMARASTGIDNTKHADEIDPVYIALCNGEELRSPVDTAKLKCFNRKTKIPYLYAKEEVMNYDPRVSLFHEVISENETKLVRTLAESQLDRSLVEAPAGFERDKIRISQTAWLHDVFHPIIGKLSRRIETLTGLNLREKDFVSDCEPLQVLNYGVGGLYVPHYDYLEETADVGDSVPTSLLNSGDRIATWLFYLSDVQYGGSTVYPKLKVRVPVTK
ncbi:hypothetical protein ScPMuIL_011772, partial [Solemya velum]